jgi:hypothetical protein
VTAQCTNQGCQFTPKVPEPPSCSSDPCVSNPCGNLYDSFCVQTVCINNLTSSSGGYSCDSVTNATEKAICQNFITNGDSSIGGKKRYCFAEPKQNVCPVNTRCANYTCNATAAVCDVLDIGALCRTANNCQKDACNPTTGCYAIAKSAAEIALQCNDRNACTSDSCNVLTGNCEYTPGAVVCPTSNACKNYTCNATTGGCDLDDIGSRCNVANNCQVERMVVVVCVQHQE